MTIAATSRRSAPYLGNGSTTAFPFVFKVFTQADIQVILTRANGITSTLALTTGYFVTLNPDQNVSPGGTVVTLTPPAPGDSILIGGNLPFDQPLALPPGGNFSPLALENQLDRMVIMMQQLTAGQGGAGTAGSNGTNGSDGISFTPGDSLGLLPPPGVRAGQILGFDSNGNVFLYTPAAAGAFEYGIPQNILRSDYTTVFSDSNKHIYQPEADAAQRNWRIADAASVPYQIGTCITFVSHATASGVRINCAGSDTLYLAGGTSTGLRTLAPGGTSTALKIAPTTWVIAGTGLT